MQLVAMGAQDVFLQVILKLLFSKLSTEDTLTFPKNAIKQEFNGNPGSSKNLHFSEKW